MEVLENELAACYAQIKEPRRPPAIDCNAMPIADEPHRLELRALIAGPRSPGFSYFFSEMLSATRNAPQQWRR